MINYRSLIKNFFILFNGQIIAQIFGFAFYLIFPKFYTPEDFATFGLFTSGIFVISEIVNLKLDIVVMISEAKEEYAIVSASFIIAALISILSIIIGYFFIPNLCFLFGITIFFIGINNPLMIFFNKYKRYNLIKNLKIFQIIISGLSSLLFIILLKINNGLIYGFVIGIFSNTLISLLYIDYKQIKIINISPILKKFIHFNTFGTISSIINSLSRNCIIFILSMFFAQNLIGQYSFATKLISTPTSVYINAVSQIYFKEAVELEGEKLLLLTKKITLISFLLGLIPVIFIYFYGEEIFEYLFPSKWALAGTLSKYLIFWYFVNLIVSPFAIVLDVNKKLKEELFFNVLLLIFNCLAVYLCGMFGDFKLTIIIFSITNILLFTFFYFYILKILNESRN